ncbi:TRAP transporter substrate-binding protein [Pararhodospirillum photometricum]|uniref:TRAP transporter substrate-binding protein n=1 Tax=Pararhodospirillum photometricum TaxID=1084 RepID=UPI0012FEDAC9|nr:TRAP transporter substrate-binding protein [Pararhodospirillum photometricum]
MTLSLMGQDMPARAQPPQDRTLILGHMGGSRSPQHLLTQVLGDTLKGHPATRQVTLEEHGGGTMGDDLDLWRAVSLGAIDLAVVTVPAISSHVPELGVLLVPFLFRDMRHAAKVFHGPLGEGVGQAVGREGLVLLSFVVRGFNRLTNARRPVRRAEDVRGLRVRIIPNPIYNLTYAALGAQVVPMAWPAVYGALDDGRIDGQENPLLSLAGQDFSRVQKYLSLTTISQNPQILVMNAEAFRALSPQEQEALTSAARTAARSIDARLEEGEAAVLEGFRQEGMELIENVDHDTFRVALAPLEPEWEARFGADLLRRLRAAADEP